MATPLRLLSGCLFVLLRPAGAQEALYYVDVARSICEGRDVELRIQIPSDKAKRSSIYAPAFYRTAASAVAFTYEFSDSAGHVIVPNTSISLQEHHGRMLSAIDASEQAGLEVRDGVAKAPASEPTDDEGLCEDFFLSNGRSPVELPDTWNDAREAFRGICEQEGVAPDCAADELTLFDGWPGEGHAFQPSPAFCDGLVVYLARWGGDAAVMARRLKGGAGGHASVGGGRSHGGGWSSASHTGAFSYGYSAGHMRTIYPGGYALTGYGYSGYGAFYPRYGTSGVVVAAATMGALTGYGAARWSHRVGSQSSCHGTSSGCGWDLLGEALVRDDVMTHRFKPSEMTYPLTLVIRNVSGAGFDASVMCAFPAGNASNASAPGVDLFFSLVPVAPSDEGAGIWGVVAFTPILIVMGCLGYCCCFRPPAKTYKKMKRLRRSRETAEPIGNATRCIGGGSHFILKGANQPAGKAQHTFEEEFSLNIDASGRIAGRTSTGNLLGKVISMAPNELRLAWTFPEDIDWIEVEAVLRRHGDMLVLRGEWYAARASGLGPDVSTRFGLLELRGVAPAADESECLPLVMGKPIGAATCCAE